MNGYMEGSIPSTSIAITTMANFKTLLLLPT